jgi:hypothetical protein
MSGTRTHTHAEHADGTVRRLAKDCDCVVHEGPHWLHADAVAKRLNAPLLERGQLAGFAQEEAARLREKLYQMQSRGIVRLLTPEAAG